MKKLLFALLLLRFTEAICQVQGKDAQGNVTDFKFDNMFRANDNRFEGIEGYPTLVKAYCPGQITMITGKKVNFDSVNLDIYSNDVLVKRNNTESVFIRKLVKEFSLECAESTKTFFRLKNLEGSESFYQLLGGGKVKLLKNSYKTISGPTNTGGAFSSGSLNSEFIEKSKMYIQKDNGDLFELKNKKILISQFPDQEEEISKFMKSNKINLIDENDTIKLIEFINTLL